MPNGVQIDEEQFMEQSEKNQHLILYRNIIRLDKKLSFKGKVDTAVNAITGFIGGCFFWVVKGFLK